MSDYLIQSSTLEDIADAIRSKTGGSALINPEDIADAIDSIQTGGAKIERGSFTLQSDQASHSWAHSLGAQPTIVFVYPSSLSGISKGQLGGVVCYGSSFFVGTPLQQIAENSVVPPQKTGFYYSSRVLSEPVGRDSAWYVGATDTSISFGGSAAQPIPANVTFNWGAILVEWRQN